jgi:hypothetical protein
MGKRQGARSAVEKQEVYFIQTIYRACSNAGFRTRRAITTKYIIPLSWRPNALLAHIYCIKALALTTYNNKGQRSTAASLRHQERE